MAKITLKKEIELKDLINILLLIIGGILTYFLINASEVKNNTLKTKQLLLQELPDLYPNLKINYTNQFSPTKDSLLLRVYMKNEGKFPLELKWIYLHLKMGNKIINHSSYQKPNLYDYKGHINPGTEFQIQYEIMDYGDSIPDRIELNYVTFLDTNIVKAYQELLTERIKSLDDSTLLWITKKEFTYRERTYEYGKNPKWDDFFEKPR